MIITRSPLRITLGGGGTDIPSYYRQHGGFCVAAAIDKYVYVTLHETFEPGITLKYSKYEKVAAIDEIEHPIFREALKMVGIRNPHLEIASHADIPAGTGLGSSSAFTCALLKALYAYRGMDFDNEALARLACELEIDRLGEPIGKQDQYISALGGFKAFSFYPDECVEIANVSPGLNDFESWWSLGFTGTIRSASDALAAEDPSNYDEVKRAGYEAYDGIIQGSTEKILKAINHQWELKFARGSVSEKTFQQRAEVMKSSVMAGKLIGAGGGGFLLFFGKQRAVMRVIMHNAGLREVRFKFDYEGTKIV